MPDGFRQRVRTVPIIAVLAAEFFAGEDPLGRVRTVFAVASKVLAKYGADAGIAGASALCLQKIA